MLKIHITRKYSHLRGTRSFVGASTQVSDCTHYRYPTLADDSDNTLPGEAPLGKLSRKAKFGLTGLLGLGAALLFLGPSDEDIAKQSLVNYTRDVIQAEIDLSQGKIPEISIPGIRQEIQGKMIDPYMMCSPKIAQGWSNLLDRAYSLPALEPEYN